MCDLERFSDIRSDILEVKTIVQSMPWLLIETNHHMAPNRLCVQRRVWKQLPYGLKILWYVYFSLKLLSGFLWMKFCRCPRIEPVFN